MDTPSDSSTYLTPNTTHSTRLPEPNTLDTTETSLPEIDSKNDFHLSDDMQDLDLGLGRQLHSHQTNSEHNPVCENFPLHDANSMPTFATYGCVCFKREYGDALQRTACSSKSCTGDFASSSIGSSLSQLKNICKKDTETVFMHKMMEEIHQDTSNFATKGWLAIREYIGDENRSNGREVGDLKIKFLDAVSEVDRLKVDLTARCSQLESKHRAIEILQTQLEQAYQAHKLEFDICRSLDTNCRKLEKELDEVRWQFEARDYEVGHSQQNWSERLARMERENLQLHEALKRTQTELKLVQRENTVMSQEKQELMCLMQMSQSERQVVSLAESDTYQLTPAEMSVLGACNCGCSCQSSSSSSRVHPCRCAWTLVNSRREVQHLNCRVKDLTKKHEDCLKIIDLYRGAFEDQLEKNKQMYIALVNRHVRGSVFSSSDYSGSNSCSPLQRGDTLLCKFKEEQFPQEYVLNIIDMLRDRTEELFHKRLSAQLLADRIRQLETELEASATRSSQENVATLSAQDTTEKAVKASSESETGTKIEQSPPEH